MSWHGKKTFPLPKNSPDQHEGDIRSSPLWLNVCMKRRPTAPRKLSTESAKRSANTWFVYHHVHLRAVTSWSDKCRDVFVCVPAGWVGVGPDKTQPATYVELFSLLKNFLNSSTYAPCFTRAVSVCVLVCCCEPGRSLFASLFGARIEARGGQFAFNPTNNTRSHPHPSD